MTNKKSISFLVYSIILLSAIAAITGIFSHQGPGTFEYESIRGQAVSIYGKGLYQHMSSEVAVQGIAQDYVTLFLGIPLLLATKIFADKGSVKAKFLLAGVLGYFLVTYLFYLVMGMYNPLFLVYAFLLGTSFFAFSLTMLSFSNMSVSSIFHENTPVKFTGGFLIFNGIAIAFLWLSIVLPPLFNGTIYPQALEHYTTLIVQGLDLGLLLPIAVVTGILLVRKKPFGYLLGPVYFVFLSLLMTALTAKIIAMGIMGYNIIPVIFIIPTFDILAIICSVLLLKSIVKE